MRAAKAQAKRVGEAIDSVSEKKTKTAIVSEEDLARLKGRRRGAVVGTAVLDGKPWANASAACLPASKLSEFLEATTPKDYDVLPLGSRLLCELAGAVKRVSDGGNILIPEVAQERASEGVIVTRGAGVASDELQPGVRVMFSKFAGQEIAYGGQKRVLLKEEEIIAILRERKP